MSVSRLGFTTLITLALFVSPLGAEPESIQCTTSELLLGQVFEAERSVESTVENPTEAAETGYLVIDVQWNGQDLRLGFPMMIPSETHYDARVEFPTPIHTLAVGVCKQLPNGITETPDPVEYTLKKRKKDHGGEEL